MGSVAKNSLQNYLVRRISPDESYDDLLIFPRYFEIETVNACNARCAMCTIKDWARRAPIMKMDLFEKIADEIGTHAATVKRVSLYRDGEPLLDHKLPQRIAMLKQRGIRQVTISSNVALLNETRSRDLLDAGLDLIILSIDSLDKAVFEAIRIGLTHEEVMENALRFIGLRDQLRPETRIWIRMIRQKINSDEFPRFNAFWTPKLREGDRVNYHNIHNWGSQLKTFDAMVASTEPTLPCVFLWASMVIQGDGTVPLCNVDYNTKFPTGTVATDSIASLWQSPLMTARRALHLSGRKAEISLCTECNVWDEPPDVVSVAADFTATAAPPEQP